MQQLNKLQIEPEKCVVPRGNIGLAFSKSNRGTIDTDAVVKVSATAY